MLLLWPTAPDHDIVVLFSVSELLGVVGTGVGLSGLGVMLAEYRLNAVARSLDLFDKIGHRLRVVKALEKHNL